MISISKLIPFTVGNRLLSGVAYSTSAISFAPATLSPHRPARAAPFCLRLNRDSLFFVKPYQTRVNASFINIESAAKTIISKKFNFLIKRL